MIIRYAALASRLRYAPAIFVFRRGNFIDSGVPVVPLLHKMVDSIPVVELVQELLDG